MLSVHQRSPPSPTTGDRVAIRDWLVMRIRERAPTDVTCPDTSITSFASGRAPSLGFPRCVLDGDIWYITSDHPSGPFHSRAVATPWKTLLSRQTLLVPGPCADRENSATRAARGSTCAPVHLRWTLVVLGGWCSGGGERGALDSTIYSPSVSHFH